MAKISPQKRKRKYQKKAYPAKKPRHGGVLKYFRKLEMIFDIVTLLLFLMLIIHLFNDASNVFEFVILLIEIIKRGGKFVLKKV